MEIFDRTPTMLKVWDIKRQPFFDEDKNVKTEVIVEVAFPVQNKREIDEFLLEITHKINGDYHSLFTATARSMFTIQNNSEKYSPNFIYSLVGLIAHDYSGMFKEKKLNTPIHAANFLLPASDDPSMSSQIQFVCDNLDMIRR